MYLCSVTSVQYLTCSSWPPMIQSLSMTSCLYMDPSVTMGLAVLLTSQPSLYLGNFVSLQLWWYYLLQMKHVNKQPHFPVLLWTDFECVAR